MQTLKILIVEDDLVAAQDLAEILAEFGYLVTDIAQNYKEGLLAFRRRLPDLVILDIDLGNESADGIELAQAFNQIERIPLVFLSGNYDKAHRNRAYDVTPADFLIKPYSETQIELTIERILRNHKSTKVQAPLLTGNDHCFVRENDCFTRLNFTDIIYLEGAGSSTILHCENKKRVISTSLADLLRQINFTSLLRIHKSFAVNLNKVTSFHEGQVIVFVKNEKQTIAIGRSYKNKLMSHLKKIKSS